MSPESADRGGEPRGPSTLSVHAGAPEPRPGEPVVTPIVQSSTFFMEPDGEVLYTRDGTNPNHDSLAAKLAALEGAQAALVTGSGMAAAAVTLLALLEAGDHVAASAELYGGTLALLTGELPRLGIEVDLVEDDDWESVLRPTTRVLWTEAVSNPTLRIADLPRLARLADARALALVVDATFATPMLLRPLEHGARAVIHSGTKYLAGHSDVVAGVVAGDRELVEAARTRMKRFGSVLDPGASWLVERGVKTLALRVERQCANALELARWLEEHPAVATVIYPGLASHPDHGRAGELLRGYGGMLSLVVPGGDEAAAAVLRRLRLVRVAPSLGGVETLASMPAHTSHIAMDPAERRLRGIADGFIRLSIGIEDVEDVRADLAQALGAGAGSGSGR